MFAELGRILANDGSIVFSTHHPSASRRWFDLKDYFQLKLVKEVWRIDGTDYVVKYYHRFLTDMFEAFSKNQLVVDKLVEPRPLIEIKETNPLTFWKLNTMEHFLIIRLFKAS